MKEKPTGFMVVHSENPLFDGYTWPMQIDDDPKAPFNAIEPITPGGTIAIFDTRKEARAAINATHYYTKAHYPNHEDERALRYIVPVCGVKRA